MPADRLPPLTIQLRCDEQPASSYDNQSAELGIQNKAGELIAGHAAEGHAIQFTCPIEVRPDAAGAAYDFGGACVHGPRGGRFVYIGYRAQGQAGWIRRWKILLADIPAALITAALGQPEAVLYAHFLLSRSATIRPLGSGWQEVNGANRIS